MSSVLQLLQSLHPSQLLYPVHRLDRVHVMFISDPKGTSGVLMVAKDRETARELSHELACGFVAKEYMAVGVARSAFPPSGIILSDMRRVVCDEQLPARRRITRDVCIVLRTSAFARCHRIRFLRT